MSRTELECQRQVWQRVSTPVEQRTLKELVRELMLDAACIREHPDALQHIQQQLMDQAYVLSAILGQPCPTGIKAHGRNMQQCYLNAQNRLSEFMLRSADPAYGPAFRQMAAQTEKISLTLLTCIGRTLSNPQKNGRQKAAQRIHHNTRR